MKWLHACLGLLAVFLGGCGREATPEEQGRKHLEALRQAGLLGGQRGSTQILAVRKVQPVATRWSAPAGPMYWATLESDNRPAGYLAWQANGRHELMDFSLEGLTEIQLPKVKALPGVPPIQQFAVRGADGKPVASGCVPTAGGSLMAYWSNRGTFDWQADDSHEGLVLRLRDRLPMLVVADEEGYTDGKMALAGAMPDALVAGLKADAAQYRVTVDVSLVAFSLSALRQEIDEGRPALLTCNVLVPRKPELSWGHAVVAVGYAEVGGRTFVGIIDNFYACAQPGSVRWIDAARCQALVWVHPLR
ncbi:MAG: hypothetical protein RIR91_1968 [Verrucomicrobiota bacterium]